MLTSAGTTKIRVRTTRFVKIPGDHTFANANLDSESITAINVKVFLVSTQR